MIVYSYIYVLRALSGVPENRTKYKIQARNEKSKIILLGSELFSRFAKTRENNIITAKNIYHQDLKKSFFCLYNHIQLFYIETENYKSLNDFSSCEDICYRKIIFHLKVSILCWEDDIKYRKN